LPDDSSRDRSRDFIITGGGTPALTGFVALHRSQPEPASMTNYSIDASFDGDQI